MIASVALRLLAGLALLLASTAAAGAAGRLTVFAASSLGDVLTAAEIAFERATGIDVRISFAASSVLARQIEHGAPADLFISANRAWVDHLITRGMVDAGGTRVIAENTLAVVAPGAAGAPAPPLSAATDLAAMLGADGRLALADPAHVPAGIYARQALQAVGLWSSVADRLAVAANVRAALALVQRGEAPLGIVYATDAVATPGVHAVATIPAELHHPIRYHLAAVAGRQTAAGKAFSKFLTGPEGRAILKAAGFAVGPG